MCIHVCVHMCTYLIKCWYLPRPEAPIPLKQKLQGLVHLGKCDTNSATLLVAHSLSVIWLQLYHCLHNTSLLSNHDCQMTHCYFNWPIFNVSKMIGFVMVCSYIHTCPHTFISPILHFPPSLLKPSFYNPPPISSVLLFLVLSVIRRAALEEPVYCNTTLFSAALARNTGFKCKGVPMETNWHNPP